MSPQEIRKGSAHLSNIEWRGGGNLTEMTLLLDPALPPGTVVLPYEEPPDRLRLGTATVRPDSVQQGEPGQVRLARDLWQKLSVPYEAIRLLARPGGAGELELGPAVGVLYAGKPKSYGQRWLTDAADFSYGPFSGAPGLYAFAFDEAVDWEQGTMHGVVIDNRPDARRSTVEATFPIPAALRLAWSIRKEAIEALKERTGNRAFNWVRSIGKWQFHTTLSADGELREHLPETRLLRSAVDVSAMLTRHGTVFLKHVHGIKGHRSMRVRLLEDCMEARYLDGHRQIERRLPLTGLHELMDLVRQVLGQGRCIVQQGIAITGREGRALHFRVLLMREPTGSWRCAALTADVAASEGSVFTNLSCGSTESDALVSLEQHYGMAPDHAAAIAADMVSLCCRGAALLQEQFDPLGILGFDVVVDAPTGQLRLLEANAVPGWGYPEPVERDLASGLIAYALSLTSFGADMKHRRPE